MLRTALHAIAAGGTRHGNAAIENVCSLTRDSHLLFCQRLEILHVRGVIVQLFIGAHAREHHHHLRLRSSEAYGPRSHRKVGLRLPEHLFHPIGHIDQRAPFDRLHHHHWLLMLADHIVALARLNAVAVPIYIVQLNLHQLYLRMLCEDEVQHIGSVVERDTYMLDFPLSLQLL